jgi:hypothetical protein
MTTVFIYIFCLESFAELSIWKATEVIKYKSPASESRTDVSLPVIKHSSCGHVNICRVHLRVSELVRRPAVRQTRQTVVINSCSLSIRARSAGLNKRKVAHPTSLCWLVPATTFQHPQLWVLPAHRTRIYVLPVELTHRAPFPKQHWPPDLCKWRKIFSVTYKIKLSLNRFSLRGLQKVEALRISDNQDL